MRTIPEARCPSSACLRSYLEPLRSVFSWGPPRPAWLEELIQEKKQNPERRTDLIFECPYCKVVWSQPSNFDEGFRAVLKGYDRGNPDQLESVPPNVRAIDPPVRRIADSRPKRSGAKR